MAATPASTAALQAYLDKRFTEFEDRTCLLFCQIVAGINNRIVKESNITSRHILELKSKLRALETGNEPVEIRAGDRFEAFIPKRPA